MSIKESPQIAGHPRAISVDLLPVDVFRGEDEARTQMHRNSLLKLTENQYGLALVLLYSRLYDAMAGREKCKLSKRKSLDQRVDDLKGRITTIRLASTGDLRNMYNKIE